MVKSGIKEIEIISQDTTRYWVDLYKKPQLLELLEEIDKIDKNKKKKPKTQTTPAKLTEIKENQEETMAQEKDKAIYKKLDEMNKKLSKMLTRDQFSKK